MSTISINSNIQSLRTQRQLGDATSSISRTFERLSSGARINRTSDDAAGLAIADSLRVANRLYTQALRNTNDGISAIRIATGALQQQSGILTRLMELAEQGASGTFSASQRASMNDEYVSLFREFGRIGDTTSFNGVSLLRGRRPGALSELQIQSGITGDLNSRIRLRTSDMGTLSGVINYDSLVSTVDAVTNLYGTQPTFEELRREFNNALVSFTAIDSAGRTREMYIAFGTVSPGELSVAVFQRSTFSEEGQAPASGVYELVGDDILAEAISHIIDYDVSTGRVTSGQLSFTHLNSGGGTTFISLDLSGLLVSSSASSQGPNLGGSTFIEMTGVENEARALNALDTLRRKIDEMGSVIGSFGALESRLLSASNLAMEGSIGASAAESRIRDVDVAEEAAALIRNQILQQSASQVLRLANNQPLIALNLLGLR